MMSGVRQSHWASGAVAAAVVFCLLAPRLAAESYDPQFQEMLIGGEHAPKGSKATANWFAKRVTGDMYDLTVYIEGEMYVPMWIRAPGEKLASDIFGAIGIRVKWNRNVPPEEQVRKEGAMLVDIRYDWHEEQGAAAAAMPYEGSRITIAYSHMRWIESHPGLGPKVFGYVLVHEIAHNLQGVSRHSRTGIMKAIWDTRDYIEMKFGTLHFEPFDIELIHAGLASRGVLLSDRGGSKPGASKLR